MDCDDLVRAGPIEVSPELACACWVSGAPVSLSARQVRLLAALVSASGRLLTREALFLAATGRSLPCRSRAVDMDVWRIRRALGAYGGCIRSVRKVGYALDVAALEHRLVTRP